MEQDSSKKLSWHRVETSSASFASSRRSLSSVSIKCSKFDHNSAAPSSASSEIQDCPIFMESIGFLTQLEIKKDLHGIGQDAIMSKPDVVRLIFAKRLGLIFSTEDMLAINHCIKKVQQVTYEQACSILEQHASRLCAEQIRSDSKHHFFAFKAQVANVSALHTAMQGAEHTNSCTQPSSPDGRCRQKQAIQCEQLAGENFFEDSDFINLH